MADTPATLASIQEQMAAGRELAKEKREQYTDDRGYIDVGKGQGYIDESTGYGGATRREKEAAGLSGSTLPADYNTKEANLGSRGVGVGYQDPNLGLPQSDNLQSFDAQRQASRQLNVGRTRKGSQTDSEDEDAPPTDSIGATGLSPIKKRLKSLFSPGLDTLGAITNIIIIALSGGITTTVYAGLDMKMGQKKVDTFTSLIVIFVILIAIFSLFIGITFFIIVVDQAQKALMGLAGRVGI